MQDVANARLMNTAATGNGRRESYSHPPMPRMTNTFMPAGKYAPEEIIASVETRFCMRKNFSGGEVDITNGNFVFAASRARLIEKGKLGATVKGATIIGNGPAIMPLVSMVGNNFFFGFRRRHLRKKRAMGFPVGVGQTRHKSRCAKCGRRRRLNNETAACRRRCLRYDGVGFFNFCRHQNRLAGFSAVCCFNYIAFFYFAALPAVFFVKFPTCGWKPIIAVGIILGAVKFSLLFLGMDAGVGAGLASLLLQAQIFFTIALAVILRGEKTGAMRTAGLFLGAFGLALIGAHSESGGNAAGIILIIAAAFAWAIANMFMRELKQVNIFHFTVWMSIVPVLPLLAASAAYEGADNIIKSLSGATWTGAAALFYVALISTVVGFAVWGRLLSLYPAAAVAPFALLVPVAGIFSGWLFLGERITAGEWAGAVVIFTGLALSIFGGRAPRGKKT